MRRHVWIDEENLANRGATPTTKNQRSPPFGSPRSHPKRRIHLTREPPHPCFKEKLKAQNKKNLADGQGATLTTKGSNPNTIKATTIR